MVQKGEVRSQSTKAKVIGDGVEGEGFLAGGTDVVVDTTGIHSFPMFASFFVENILTCYQRSLPKTCLLPNKTHQPSSVVGDDDGDGLGSKHMHCGDHGSQS